MAERQDVTEIAREKLIQQVRELRPDRDVRGGFRASKGWSPTILVLLAAVPMVPIVAVAVLSKRWFLLVVAFAVMVVALVLLFGKVNSVRVVAETDDDLVVFAKRAGELHEIERRPKALTLEHYWDRQWNKVILGDETLWVSRRFFEPTLERLSAHPA
ncbi:MAG: hypothetical protein ACXV95_05700 [Acidimicrobiales bacterium]